MSDRSGDPGPIDIPVFPEFVEGAEGIRFPPGVGRGGVDLQVGHDQVGVDLSLVDSRHVRKKAADVIRHRRRVVELLVKLIVGFDGEPRRMGDRKKGRGFLALLLGLQPDQLRQRGFFRQSCRQFIGPTTELADVRLEIIRIHDFAAQETIRAGTFEDRNPFAALGCLPTRQTVHAAVLVETEHHQRAGISRHLAAEVNVGRRFFDPYTLLVLNVNLGFLSKNLETNEIQIHRQLAMGQLSLFDVSFFANGKPRSQLGEGSHLETGDDIELLRAHQFVRRCCAWGHPPKQSGENDLEIAIHNFLLWVTHIQLAARNRLQW